ncbi:sterol 3-beta-glucosyltransferase UGT80A2-like isoform X6 [Primulina eburnea]|uniref:sterol 3-beta-glucosyltransferase UGT80A2-like isoform X6 n=1 Tax=Primulina eburnea TaxID=1245227 RepID=UPI003C6C2CBA
MHECVMAEFPVDFVVEVEGENGDGKVEESRTSEGVNGISHYDPRSGCAESVDRNLPGENFNFMEQSPKDLSDPTSSQVTMVETEKINHSLSVLLRKFLNENLAPKKKLKLVKRLATIQNDGTVQLDVGENIKPQSSNSGTEVIDDGDIIKDIEITEDTELLPPLQIVMLIVGTRGDVQPFIAIGKRLQDDGHRVRLATHSNFKEFVMAAGLEFYPLGGDPKVLAAYMVKNKGFLPSEPSEIHLQRSQIKEIIFSLLPACTSPDPDTNISFKVDAIIANPPAYGHTHVAEALKVPLHIFFTMPWTPTSEFPHPLSRVRQPVGNRLSYQIVDALIWLGIRDMINEFRKKKLKLRPMTYLSGSYNSSSAVPYGYIWSPHLVPKPKDWGSKIDVVGFCFLELASSYEPPESLLKWLEDKEKPIYIGFGSLDNGALSTKAGVAWETWQSQRTLSTFWKTVPMIGFSQDAQLWYTMEVLEQLLLVLKLHARQLWFLSLEINPFGEHRCMLGELVRRQFLSMNFHSRNWSMRSGSCSMLR